MRHLIIAILLVGLVLVVAIPMVSCTQSEPKPFPPPEGYSSWDEYNDRNQTQAETPSPTPSASFVLQPSDVGQDWSYEVKIGKTSYGVNYPQFFQDGRQFSLGIRRVVKKDNAAIIEEFMQNAMVYPYLEEALNDVKNLGDNHQSFNIQGWDEVYLITRLRDRLREESYESWVEETREEGIEETGLILREDNCVIHLYYREVLYKEDPITGKFYFSEYTQFNKEKAQWAEEIIFNLAEIIISRQ